MRDKLESIASRFYELEGYLSDPKIIANQELWQEYVKEHGRLRPIVEGYERLVAADTELAGAREMQEENLDGETRGWVREEIMRLEEEIETLETELRVALVPPDPRDDKNVIVEVRAGTGGGEAALFASDLHRMYTRYAENKGWKTEILSGSATDIGGYREIIFSINGQGAYSRLKYESGVHRVQRVPVTESGGRIHTSTATVAVLPEAEDIEVDIDPDDLKVDTYGASGPGGQHVNKTESAVRITHLPSGLVVTCQDEKSQHKNRAKALRVLRARLLDQYEREQHSERAEARRAQVGTGDRSERIRTYNFPQNRVTDHRVGLTLHQMDLILDGALDPVIEAVVSSVKEEQLEEAAPHGDER